VSAPAEAFHFGEFAILAALLTFGALVAKPANQGVSRRIRLSGSYAIPAVVAASIVAAFYGATDEWHQTYVTGREGSLGDLAYDAVGALFGGLMSWVIFGQIVGRSRK
jgi:VanZ family protein